MYHRVNEDTGGPYTQPLPIPLPISQKQCTCGASGVEGVHAITMGDNGYHQAVHLLYMRKLNPFQLDKKKHIHMYSYNMNHTHTYTYTCVCM